jgi:hypothetical protein
MGSFSDMQRLLVPYPEVLRSVLRNMRAAGFFRVHEDMRAMHAKTTPILSDHPIRFV